MALLARYAARALEPREGAALEAHMRRLGILRAYALSGAYLADADTAGFRTQLSAERKQSLVRQENDFAAEMVRNADNRLALFASVNPNRSYSASELERCVAELGACGLKLHFWNSLVDVRQRTHLQRVKQVMEAADRHALSVMLHAFNGAVAGGFRAGADRG